MLGDRTPALMMKTKNKPLHWTLQARTRDETREWMNKLLVEHVPPDPTARFAWQREAGMIRCTTTDGFRVHEVTGRHEDLGFPALPEKPYQLYKVKKAAQTEIVLEPADGQFARVESVWPQEPGPNQLRMTFAQSNRMYKIKKVCRFISQYAAMTSGFTVNPEYLLDLYYQNLYWEATFESKLRGITFKGRSDGVNFRALIMPMDPQESMPDYKEGNPWPVFRFDCPSCDEPWAYVRGNLVDVHGGATYTCALCEAKVTFDVHVVHAKSKEATG